MKKVLKFISFIISLILSIVLYLVVIILMSLFLFRNLISEETIHQMISNSNILELEINDKDLKESILEKTSNYGISEILVRNVLEDFEFNQIISDFINEYNKYLQYGGDKPNVSIERVNELILKKQTQIEQTTGYIIPDNQIDELTNIASSLIEKIDDQLPLREEIVIDDKVETILDFIYSDWSFVAMICLIIVILILIMLFRFSVLKPLVWSGTTFILAGSSLTLIAVLKPFISYYIIKMDNVYSSFFEIINDTLFKILYFYGIGVLLLGVVMVILYNILKKKIDE